MTTTSTDLVNETLRHLYSGQRDPMNKLNGSLDASTTTVVLTYELGSALAGSYISVDLEIMYIWEVVSANSMTLTVQRGVLGSTAATHSDGAVVTVNPRFPAFSVLEAINEDLDDLSGNGLFQVATAVVTYNPSIDGYDIDGADDLLDILDVKYEQSGTENRWPMVKNWRLIRASDTTDFPSGLGLILNSGGQSGYPIRISYSVPFARFTALAQNIASTTGLPATANDLPPLGAALRLQSVREGQRNFNEAQPMSRRANEVQTGAQLVGARGLQELRRQRIRIEARRLQKLWPRKSKIPS